MLENKSDVEKNASEQKCCGKVPVQNMGGVILDIDGTVLDSMSIWQDAGVRYLASQQIEAEPGLAEKIYYMSIPEAALYMRTRYGLEQSVEEISQGIKDVVRDFYYYEAPLKAGVKEFLQKCQIERFRSWQQQPVMKIIWNMHLHDLEYVSILNIFYMRAGRSRKAEPGSLSYGSRISGQESGRTVCF